MSASSSNSAPAAPAAPPSTPAITSQWGLSPIPAWLFSSALVVSPMLRPSPVLENPHTSGSTLLRAGIRPTAYPSNAQVVLFSSFVGLGGFMCYDKDPVNGAAVVGVWSLLYFMSNVKKSMWNLKLYPKALSSFALVNSALYGAKYLGFV